MVELCVTKGYNVKAFVRYNSKNNWGWLEKSKFVNDIEVNAGDIRDYDSVKEAIKQSDIVFHLAALIGIPYSYISPLAYLKTNVEGTYNILQVPACHDKFLKENLPLCSYPYKMWMLYPNRENSTLPISFPRNAHY